MTNRNKFNAGLLALIVSAVPFAEANAQDLQPGQTVRDRPRPEVDPLGVRAGSFLIFPRVDIGESYDDNVFRTDSGTEDDFITTVNPAVQAESNWSNHALEFGGYAEAGFYASNSDENYVDYGVNLGGRYDYSGTGLVDGRITYDHLHEERGDPDDLGANEEPIEYDLLTGRIGLDQGFGRFGVRPEFIVRNFDYDDVPLIAGGIANQDDRDRWEYDARLFLTYEIAGPFDAYIGGGYNLRDYDDDRDDRGFQRDSDGWEALVGTEIDLGGVAFGEVYAGFTSRSFDDPAFDDIDEPIFGAEVFWNVTELTTISLSADRNVEETTVFEGGRTSSASVDSEVALRVDHELLRNLLIGGDASYGVQDFDNISREDDFFEIGADVTYLMNRYIWLSADYSFIQRDSNTAGSDYDANVFMIEARLQL